jgi:murein DD-endopeptidase MepM/ murein hydrolase activator NlpD
LLRSTTPGSTAVLHAQKAPRFDPGLVEGPTVAPEAVSLLPVQVALQRGETLGSLLSELGLRGEVYQLALGQLSEHVDPRRLRPGLEITAFYDETSQPVALEVHLQGRGELHLVGNGRGWEAHFRPFEERVVVRRVEGVVEGSLIRALERAGAPADVAYRMAEVLRWDVDFNRDLQPGDRFRALYQEVLLDGAFHRVGDVVAAQLWNRGRRLDAFRFDEGYYDEEGRPLRKMFLRSPVAYTRISSRFSHRRFHPILKRHRPHYGVDFAAPTGTPIQATADGVITLAAWEGGGGNTVRIRHPNEYQSVYLHLSRFASGVRRGSRVRQGDVIGYVGATGLATGPHVCYRVQHRGRWIDPLSIRNVPAEPIPSGTLPVFVAWRDQLLEGLENGAPPGLGDVELARSTPVGSDPMATTAPAVAHTSR